MSAAKGSGYICARDGLPLQRMGSGWKHAVNAHTRDRSCGQPPLPTSRNKQPLRVGMTLSVWQPAGVVTLDHRPYRQRFRPGAFAHLLNEHRPLRRAGVLVAYARVIAADTATDGSGVTFTLEITESTEDQEEAA